MAGEWRVATIGEVAEKVAMGPFGSSIKVETFVPDGVPVISGQHLHGFKVDDEVGFNFITPEHAERLKNANVRRGDIVLTHRGNIGQVAYIPEHSKFNRYVVSQSQFYMRCDRSKVIPEFVAAYLKTPEGQHKLLANTSQVGVPSIAQPVTYLRTIELPLPPIPEQRAIAHVLGTLDDKIDLLRRMNETLEAMARAIFKAWFVDFEPVRAKMEGRWRRGQSLPGLPAHLYDLFADRLVDSELGEIPEGWRYASVGDEVQVVKGVSYRSEELADSDTALVTLKSINRGGGYRRDGLKPYRGKYKPEQVITAGELVVAQTDVTQAAEVIGRPALALPDDRFQVLVASLDILIIRPTKGDLPREFFYLLFLTSEFQDHIYGHTNGTTVLHLAKTGVPSYVFVRPPAPVAHAFAEVIVSLFQRIAHNESLSRTLAALRDALLPKLISGGIRIEYPERIVAGEMP